MTTSTIVAIKKISHTVTVVGGWIPSGYTPLRVLVDDVEYGKLLTLTPEGQQRQDPFPRIWELQILFGDGRFLTVATSTVNYSANDGDRKRLSPDHVFINREVYTYQRALSLKVGDSVENDQPFRFDMGRTVLSNGVVTIPTKRPVRAEWRNWPQIDFLKGITVENWELMLQALHGKFLREIVVKTVRQTMGEFRTQKRQQEVAQRRLQTLIAGQCFSDENAQSVSVGENFIFTLTHDGQTVHIVDSPEYGHGLYVFQDYGDAYNWASRRIGFRLARKRAIDFITHHNGWRDRLTPVLKAA